MLFNITTYHRKKNIRLEIKEHNCNFATNKPQVVYMRQQLLLSETTGYYHPSFFRMHINTTEKIERIEYLNANDFSTLMHEYIHFIQDVTTIYGLGNIYNSVQYIKYATNEIYETKDEFKVPIKLDIRKLEGSMIDFGNYLYKETFGKTKAYDGSLFKVEARNIPLTKHLNMKSLPVYDLKINVEGYGAYSYRFGAGCIMESMAYILEKCLSGLDINLGINIEVCTAK